MNISYSWKTSLVFFRGFRGLTFRLVLTSRQRFPDFWSVPGRQVRRLSSNNSGSLTVQLALPSPTSERGYNVPYPAIYWLNDDILLNIFNCYRLYGDGLWNIRLGWCKLSHVCQRWRHLMFESAFHLDMYIECASGTPILNTLDHIPPLPLFINYKNPITKEDEKGIYYALGLHDRVRHIHLDLSSSILHKVLVLLDEYFPLLEHLSLSFAAENSIPIAFPKAFLAPSLRHLALPGINPPKRLRLLTFAVSLVILHLSNIETSSYFRPRLLVARLRSLPQLAELSISFSTPIPRPSAEMELLGEQGTPVTLPNLQTLQFKGVSAYLESVIAQIRVPLLKWFVITLFNQIAFALPHLSRFINRIEGSQLPALRIHFDPNEVSIVTACHHDGSPWFDSAPLFLRVMCNCKQLDWQIDCATQICNALGPAIIGVERFTLDCYYLEIPTAFQNGTIDSTTWHELLRSFIGVKELHVADALLEEFSRALQEDDIGSHPGILPNLQYIRAADNLFTVFIDARQAVGRPVQFLRLY